MNITAKDVGTGSLTVGMMKNIIEGLPDEAVMTIVAGQDDTAGHYIVEAAWDPTLVAVQIVANPVVPDVYTDANGDLVVPNGHS